MGILLNIILAISITLDSFIDGKVFIKQQFYYKFNYK